jgi:hypothetical protein
VLYSWITRRRKKPVPGKCSGYTAKRWSHARSKRAWASHRTEVVEFEARTYIGAKREWLVRVDRYAPRCAALG